MEYIILGPIVISGLLAWNSISVLKKKNQKLMTHFDNLADKTGILSYQANMFQFL